ncbi:MAG: hypothetical protein O3A37_09400, partial [Planctomycetota bacterium]|nr:hypothetical protein [Planctomycetota bacterium]
MRKRLTFSFLPWVAAAGVCLGTTLVRGDEGSVLVEGADGAVAEGEAMDACADPCMKTVKVWRMVPELRDVEVTEWTTEVRERTFTVKKKVPKLEERTHNYTVMVPEKRTKTVEYTVNV